jgi:hypothetical protein
MTKQKNMKAMKTNFCCLFPRIVVTSDSLETQEENGIKVDIFLDRILYQLPSRLNTFP